MKHQLQALPPVESFYSDLKAALSWWIEEVELAPTLATISVPVQEEVIAPVHFPEWQAQSRLGIVRTGYPTALPTRSAIQLDHIRFAARNRLCIEITYHGVKRLVEPYSLRRPLTGNLLLYGYELRKGAATGGGIKAYKVAEIADTQLTQQAFTPKYIVEL